MSLPPWGSISDGSIYNAYVGWHLIVKLEDWAALGKMLIELNLSAIPIATFLSLSSFPPS